MFKTLAIGAALALAAPTASFAAGGESHTEDFAFSFEGPFGTYDQNQLQRGLQLYTEVCSSCHGLQYVPLRTLGDPGGPGLPEEQVRAYAAENFSVFDPELDDDRPAKPTDHFPANTAAGAPDLSLMAKARAGFHGPYGLGINQLVKGMGGAEYIASILTGYTGEEKEEAGAVFYENTAFPGGWIAMAPPLYGEDVEFADGHSSELHHEAQDVAAFLMWAAEPKMMARKQAGFIGVLMLTVLTVLLYLTNKRLWAPVKGKKTV
ncbi:MAG: cytochrome c1 [Jhaorihella sp.]